MGNGIFDVYEFHYVMGYLMCMISLCNGIFDVYEFHYVMGYLMCMNFIM